MPDFSIRSLRWTALTLALALTGPACQCSKPSEPPAPAPTPVASKHYVPKDRCPVARPAVAAVGEAPEGADLAPTEEEEDAEFALIARAFDTSFEKQNFDAALACAQELSRLFPDDPVGHIQRGMALDALEEYIDAHKAFERAIAIDPFNPDALLPAADFLAQSSGNDALETAVIYSRRGRENEKSAERSAEFAAIEAEALNGIGRCEEALRAAESALALNSELPRAMIERGVALFELLRFEEAEKALAEGRQRNPKSAKAFHYGGLIAERFNREAEADRLLKEATRLDPEIYPAMLDVSQMDFQKLVDAEVKALSPEDQAALATTKFSWQDLPALDDLMAGDPVLSPTIVGIFRPGERPEDPNAILLYRKNLLRLAPNKDELRREVRDTLLHEIGHLNGEDDEELRDRGL